MNSDVADELLEYAIYYSEKGFYPEGLTKDKKRAVRKKAKSISVERGEVFVHRRGKKVKCRCMYLEFTSGRLPVRVQRG